MVRARGARALQKGVSCSVGTMVNGTPPPSMVGGWESGEEWIGTR